MGRGFAAIPDAPRFRLTNGRAPSTTWSGALGSWRSAVGKAPSRRKRGRGGGFASVFGKRYGLEGRRSASLAGSGRFPQVALSSRQELAGRSRASRAGRGTSVLG